MRLSPSAVSSTTSPTTATPWQWQAQSWYKGFRPQPTPAWPLLFQGQHPSQLPLPSTHLARNNAPPTFLQTNFPHSMGGALRDRRPTREAVNSVMEPSDDDMLEPEVLVLRADSRVNAVIVGENKPDVPLYSLGRSILHRSRNDDKASCSISLTPVATSSSPKALPSHMYFLECTRNELDERTYSIGSADPKESKEGHVELRPQVPIPLPAATASRNTRGEEEEEDSPLLEAFFIRYPRIGQTGSAAAAAAAPRDDTAGREGPKNSARNLLFSTRLRWLSTTELNYFRPSGRQYACEDRDYDEQTWDGLSGRRTRRLVVTRRMERRMRDVLVGVWCLRMWRERLAAKDRADEDD